MASQARRLKNQEMSGGASDSPGNGLWDRIKAHPQHWAEFLHEVRLEMRQVTWPSREDVSSTTAVVIVAVAFFGLFFFGVDSTLSFLLPRLLHVFGH